MAGVRLCPMHFYRTWRFWESVLASVAAVVLLWLLGELLEPLQAVVIRMGWDGFAWWFAKLGWFLFAATLAVWYVNRRPAGTTAGPHFLVPGKSATADGLVIHSAEYGLDGHDIDVTDHVRGLVRNNRIVVTVKNELWGGRDPVPGTRKRLRLVYSVGSQPRRAIEVTEKDRLKIP